MPSVVLWLLQVNHKRVRCAHKCAGWSQQEGADYITCSFKGKPDIKARMVIGADGVRSAVRASMFPDDPGPRFLVRHCWLYCGHQHHCSAQSWPHHMLHGWQANFTLCAIDQMQ